MGIRPNFANDVYADKETKNDEEQQEYSESSLAYRRSVNLLKLKQVHSTDQGPSSNNSAMHNHESIDNIDKDLDFEYGDCDKGVKEISELYSYSEIEEFASNINSWREYIEEKNIKTNIEIPQSFSNLSASQKDYLIQDLCCRMESSDSDVRLSAARCILFILQGSPTDFGLSEDDDLYKYEALKMSLANPPSSDVDPYEALSVYIRAVENSFIAYRNGVYQALCSLLMTEIKDPFEVPGTVHDGGRTSHASSRGSKHASTSDLSDSVYAMERRNHKSPTIVDNEMLRVIMSSLYHMIVQINDKETTKDERYNGNLDEDEVIRKQFIEELQEPLCYCEEPLLMILLDMLNPFYEGTSPHFPIKKIVLLIWKVLLHTLGGFDVLEETKAEKRRKAGLDVWEDNLKVVSSMPAIVPPEVEANRVLPPANVARTEMMSRQMACNEEGDKSESNEDSNSESETSSVATPTPYSSGRLRQVSGEQTPRAGSPEVFMKTKLPWKPKTSKADIETFIQNGRRKYFNLSFDTFDDTALFGFPPSFIGSVEILRKHLYLSLSELQIEKEEQLNRYLFSMKEEIEETKAEILYRKLLPNMCNYMCALVKVLLQSVPSSKARHEGLNILIDVVTPEMEASDILSNSISLDNSTTSPLEDGFRLAIDINRHKEIIAKAISAIILLLIKHFKQNHVYQFEYICHQIVYVNGLPLILKFLDQNTNKLIQSRHEIHAYNYPQCIYYYVKNAEQWPTLTLDNIEEPRSPTDGPYFMWRNLFFAINLVRILNKLVKGKDERVKMLMVFKSAPILKRLLKVRQSVLQFYVLKALKIQSRCLGRQWRKSNLDVVSAIFSRIRHRMTDDWAYASETKRKFDFQKKDNMLKACMERFHSRRYSMIYPQFAIEVNDAPMPGDDYLNRVDLRDFQPGDNFCNSVLGNKVVLPSRFKKNYEKWMEDEVLKSQIDWDKVLMSSKGIDELMSV